MEDAYAPRGSAVEPCHGIICFAEIYKDNIYLLFPQGAKLKDPHALLNARLQSRDIRTIEFKEAVINQKARMRNIKNHS